jgi:hypothetical protein
VLALHEATEFFGQADEAIYLMSIGTMLSRVRAGILIRFTANDLGRSTYVGLLTLLKRTAWLGWGIALVLIAVLIFRR